MLQNIEAEESHHRPIFLKLSGAVSVQIPRGKVHVFQGSHTRALLTVLGTAETGPVERSQLIDLLWGASPDDKNAKLKLRQIIHRLRKLLSELFPGGEKAIKSNKLAVWIDPNRVVTDLNRISALLEDASDTACEEAFSLWDGPVLNLDDQITSMLGHWADRLNQQLISKLKSAGKYPLNELSTEGLDRSVVRNAEILAAIDQSDVLLQRRCIRACLSGNDNDAAFRTFHALHDTGIVEAPEFVNAQRQSFFGDASKASAG